MRHFNRLPEQRNCKVVVVFEVFEHGRKKYKQHHRRFNPACQTKDIQINLAVKEGIKKFGVEAKMHSVRVEE